MPDKTGLSHLGMSAMDSADEGITIARITDPDQPLVYVNNGFLRMTGYSREDIIGRNCRFLQGPKTDPEQVKILRHAITHGLSATVEFLNFTKNMKPFWNRLTISPISAAPGEPCDYYVGVQCDITESKVKEAQIQDYADRMRLINNEAEKAIDAFTKTLSEASAVSLSKIQSLMKDADKMSREDQHELLEALQDTINAKNDMISGLRVVMKNCGGIDSFVHIDPVTLKVKRKESLN